MTCTCNLISCVALHSAMFDAEFAARNTDSEANSIAFSSVSGAAASRLPEELHQLQADGFEEAPFESPAV